MSEKVLTAALKYHHVVELSHKLFSRIASHIAFASRCRFREAAQSWAWDPADRAREKKPERAGGTMYVRPHE